MYKSIDRVVDILASLTSVGDFVLDAINVMAVRKENKRNMYLLLGTHVALSALAVGVSMGQTASIKKKMEQVCTDVKSIRQKEGRNWG
jgi:hypothetical protein